MTTIYRDKADRLSVADAKRFLLDAAPLVSVGEFHATMDEKTGRLTGPIEHRSIDGVSAFAQDIHDEFSSILQQLNIKPRHIYKPSDTNYRNTVGAGSCNDVPELPMSPGVDKSYAITHDEFVRVADAFGAKVVVTTELEVGEKRTQRASYAPAPVVADSASSAPVDGITTAQVAAIFDGIKYRAENWTRRLSDTKWLEPAKVALGAQGGASSLWKAVQKLSDELAPGASAANAGEAIARGINAFKSGFKTVQQRLYRNLDQHIPADTTIAVDNTRGVLAALNADIDGAVNLSAMFKNAKIGGIERALLADLDDAAQAAAGTGGGAAGQVAGLPYEAIKKLRTLVGNELADATFVSDVPRSKWAALYGALSDDLGVAAKNAGPDAEASWQWANQFTKTQMNRLDELSGIITKDSPEKIFNAAIAGTAEGDTIARRVISALPMRERREVSAALLQRLGRATPGQQNAAGDAFSSETFLTNLSKMSPAARNTLFGRTDIDGVIEKLEQFAAVADSRREGGRIFANPSGTAPAAAQIGLGSGIAGGVVAAAAGQPLPLMGALAVPALANAGAKLVTSPKVLEMAASQTALSPGAGAAMVNAAANVDMEAPAVQTAPMAAPVPQSEQWWLDAPMVEAAPVGAGMVAGPVDVPGAATAVDMPMALPEPMSAPMPEPMPMAAPMPLQPVPAMEPLEVLPPVDTRSPLQRLSAATTVDEAIEALHEPSPVEVAREQASQMQTERQRIEAMRDRARAAWMEAENEMKQARALRIAAERERLAAMRMRALSP